MKKIVFVLIILLLFNCGPKDLETQKSREIEIINLSIEADQVGYLVELLLSNPKIKDWFISPNGSENDLSAYYLNIELEENNSIKTTIRKIDILSNLIDFVKDNSLLNGGSK